MRKFISVVAVVLLFSGVLFAADSLTITDASGNTTTNYPVQIGRPFVQGEITNCPRPLINGVPATTWQADVKKRWPDNSVRHAIISFYIPTLVANSVNVITFDDQACSNAGLTQAQMLDPSYNFDAGMSLTNGTTVTASARTMLANGSYTVWASGPAATTVLLWDDSQDATCNGKACSKYDIGFDGYKSFRPRFIATFWPLTHQVSIRFIGENASTETIEDLSYTLTLTTGSSSPTTVYGPTAIKHYAWTRWTNPNHALYWLGGAPGRISINHNLAYLVSTKMIPPYDPSITYGGSIATNYSTWLASNRDIGGNGTWGTTSLASGGSHPHIGPYPTWVMAALYTGDWRAWQEAFGDADLGGAVPVHYREGSTSGTHPLKRGDSANTGVGHIVTTPGRPSLQGFNLSYSYTLANDKITPVGTIGPDPWTLDAAHAGDPDSLVYLLSGDYFYLEEAWFWESFEQINTGFGSGGRGQIDNTSPNVNYATLGLGGSSVRELAWDLRSRVVAASITPDALPEESLFQQNIDDALASEEGCRNITTSSYYNTTAWNIGHSYCFGGNGSKSNASIFVWTANLNHPDLGGPPPLHQYAAGSTAFAQNNYGLCTTRSVNTGDTSCDPLGNGIGTVTLAHSLFEQNYMTLALGLAKQYGFASGGLLSYVAQFYTGLIANISPASAGVVPYLIANGRYPVTDANNVYYQWSNYNRAFKPSCPTDARSGTTETCQGTTQFHIGGNDATADGYEDEISAVSALAAGEPGGAALRSYMVANYISLNSTYIDANPKWALAPIGTFDTIPPSVTLTAPGTGANITGSISLSANATDNVGVVGVQFLVDNTPVGAEIAVPPFTTSWNSLQVANGSHTIVARARDAAGNFANSAPVTVNVSNIILDSTPPTVAISAPANGATVSGTTVVAATASDNVGVVGVQFLVDGSAFGAEVTSSPYSLSFNTTVLSNANHTIAAIARDAAGNKTTSSAITITVNNYPPPPPDSTPPTVSMTAPATGAMVTGNVNVTANATDNVAVAGVQFLLDGSPLGNEVTTAPYSITWATAGVASGNHTLSARARDTSGNVATSASITVNVFNGDTTAPTVAITSPTPGASLTGTVSLTATATDNVGVVGVQFMLDGLNLGPEATVAPYSITWDTTAVSGSHTLTARARDAAGNQTVSSPVAVTVSNAVKGTDTTPPTISFTSPLAGSVLAGTAQITANATDNVGVVSVQYFLDGAAIAPAITSPPYSYSWFTLTALNGQHTLMAQAKDAAGNVGTASITVTLANVDSTPPTVSVIAPSGGAVITGPIVLTANATDNVGVAGVQFLVDGATVGTELATAPYSMYWLPLVTNGPHTIAARARDAAGNQTTSSPVSITVNDSSPPVAAITAPIASANVSGTVVITANVTDNIGVAGVQFLVDGILMQAELTTAPYSISWQTGASGNGLHTLTVVARDYAGNKVTSTGVTVNVANGDTTPPTVSLTAPSPNASISGTATLSANASDNVGVVGLQFYVDGVAVGPELNSTPYSLQWLVNVPNGPHVITATARDAAGNRTTSAPVTVQTVDLTAPTVSITGPADGSTVQGTVAIMVDASDNVGVATVQVLVDGAPLGAPLAVGPFGTSWATNAVSNGTHTISAVAADAAGNQATATPISVTVNNPAVVPPDTTPPAVAILAPGTDAVVGATTTLSAVASDDVGIASVQFFVDGNPVGPAITSAPFSMSWNVNVADGPHQITAVALDPAGNSATSQAVAFNVDQTAPSISFSSPADGATVSGSVQIIVNVVDVVDTVSIQLSVDGNPLGSPLTSPPFIATWASIAAANGAHSITATARDAAGNVATATIHVNVANATPVDTTPPTVSIIAPAAGTLVVGSVAASAVASDNIGVVGVIFTIDGTPVGTEVTAPPYTETIDTTAISSGTHVLTASARDAAGNLGTSLPVWLNFASSSAPPRVTITSPSGSSVSGVVSLAATATSSLPISSVQFQVDGTQIGSTVTAMPYSITWDTTAFANGSHTVTAIATDAGGTNGSATMIISVSNGATTSQLQNTGVDGSTLFRVDLQDLGSMVPDPASLFNSPDDLIAGQSLMVVRRPNVSPAVADQVVLEQGVISGVVSGISGSNFVMNPTTTLVAQPSIIVDYGSVTQFDGVTPTTLKAGQQVMVRGLFFKVGPSGAPTLVAKQVMLMQ